MATFEELSKKFNNFQGLLLYFLWDTYYTDRADKDTIARFVKEITAKEIQNAILEAKQILELQEFPWEWMESATNRAPCVTNPDGSESILDVTEENYIRWVKWMVEELELEVKKQGKV